MDDIVIETAAQNIVMKELCAVLFAELAMTDADPRGKLETMLNAELGMVYAAIAEHDDDSPSVQRVRTIKTAFRRSLFGLAQQALENATAPAWGLEFLRRQNFSASGAA